MWLDNDMTQTDRPNWKIDTNGIATTTEIPGLIVLLRGRKGCWTATARHNHQGPIVTVNGTQQDACNEAVRALVAV